MKTTVSTTPKPASPLRELPADLASPRRGRHWRTWETTGAVAGGIMLFVSLMTLGYAAIVFEVLW